MRHFISFAAAVFVSGTMLAATVHAETPAGYYVAVPAAPPTRAAVMTRATPWTLNGAAYVAARAPERDTVVCELVAKTAGQLRSFTAGGKAYDDDALAKCNAHAKPGAAPAQTLVSR